MLILTRRHETNPTMLLKLDRKDVPCVRTPEEGKPAVTLDRPGCSRAIVLAEYSTEDRAEEVLAQMARFSADLMRTRDMDPLFVMPLDKPEPRE